MQIITLVTGNKNKLREYGRLLPKDFPYTHKDIDLNEIQSIDSAEIIADKVRRAYEVIGTPVLVEDVTAGLSCLNGLPGPFIKYFEERMGQEVLYLMANDDKRATVTCTIGYYDGIELLLATGKVEGTVVPMRTTNGFGFDNVFMPNGSTKTFAEMGEADKDRLSHRGLAVRNLLKQLNYNTSK